MRSPSRSLELLTVLHAGIFLAGATWAFGGNADWVRPPLAAWGMAGGVLTATGFLLRRPSALRSAEPLRPGFDLSALWPFALFNLLALVSALTPGFREVRDHADLLLVPQSIPIWRPSSARPEEARQALLLFDGIYLSCFNLAFLVQRRRALRGLLLFSVANALVLAVFGTVQKLSGATGLYFGAVQSPQIYFFASFVYHNHWGAFAVLISALGVGLIRHYRRPGGPDFWQTPGFAAAISVLLLAATVPLSTSRSCTVILLLLLGGAFVQACAELVRQKRRSGRSALPALAAAGSLALAAVVGFWLLAGPTLAQRLAKTREQFAELRARGDAGTRGVLYRDTWHMARDRLLFGWGMASYPHVFMLYNTQESKADHLPVFYHDAHNDWLQSLAEHGLVGTTALGLCAVVPFRRVWRRRRRGSPSSPLPAWLLLGCALILGYAAVEFPFGNVAVVLTWWTGFFCALRYADLESPTPDSNRPAPLAMFAPAPSGRDQSPEATSLRGSPRALAEGRAAPPKIRRSNFSVLILTLDEERDLPRCLESVRFCDDVVVLDSGSADRTVELARAAGARVFTRPFDDFAGQRNFAQLQIPFLHDWVFHLDADERMTPELAAECGAIAAREEGEEGRNGFLAAPRMIFMGRWIRHSTDYPAWQARFVRTPGFTFVAAGHGQREAPGSKLGTLRASYTHEVASRGEADWLAKHRRYARDEANEALDALPGASRGSWIDLASLEGLRRRRALKRLSYGLPARPLLRFVYQYVLRRGFLDGRAGWRYCRLLARYEAFAAEEIRRRTSYRRPEPLERPVHRGPDSPQGAAPGPPRGADLPGIDPNKAGTE